MSEDAGSPPIVTDRPSMRGLAYALRHRETWPASFDWGFENAGSCAMGLCCALWHDQPLTAPAWFGGVAETLGISARDAFALFVDPCLWSVHRSDSSRPAITPEMVADEIDHYLSRHPEIA